MIGVAAGLAVFFLMLGTMHRRDGSLCVKPLLLLTVLLYVVAYFFLDFMPPIGFSRFTAAVTITLFTLPLSPPVAYVAGWILEDRSARKKAGVSPQLRKEILPRIPRGRKRMEEEVGERGARKPVLILRL